MSEPDYRLKVYDATREVLARPLSPLTPPQRAMFCEEYLAASISVAREFCPDGFGELAKKVGLDVMLAAPARRVPLLGWRRRLMGWVGVQSVGDLGYALVAVVMLAMLLAGAFS